MQKQWMFFPWRSSLQGKLMCVWLWNCSSSQFVSLCSSFVLAIGVWSFVHWLVLFSGHCCCLFIGVICGICSSSSHKLCVGIHNERILNSFWFWHWPDVVRLLNVRILNSCHLTFTVSEQRWDHSLGPTFSGCLF
jgi:hypothetical protein